MTAREQVLEYYKNAKPVKVQNHVEIQYEWHVHLVFAYAV